MRLFALLILTSMASALPPLEETTRLMGSVNATDRDQITRQLWDAGREALPLLEKLAESSDPEVSRRSVTIFHRLRMGLRPDSPEGLLDLAKQLELASPDIRASSLENLLEHPLGVPVALAALDLWSKEDFTTPEEYYNWASIVAGGLIEQRSFWQQFLTEPLTPRCRGAMISFIGHESMPMRHTMIENLAINDTREVFKEALKNPLRLSAVATESIARAALLGKDTTLALDVLFSSLPESEDGEVARAIAFVETVAGVMPRPYEGKWQDSLKLLRLRARGDLEQVKLFAPSVAKEHPLLSYESKLLMGGFETPTPDLPLDSLADTLIKALGQSYGASPVDPDIEDLASTVTNDGLRLARGLILLGHPAEAGQILADQHQPDLAVRTLWMTGHREDAQRVANKFIEHGDNKARLSMRLVLTQLLGRSGQKEAARELFSPLFEVEIKFDHLRREAIRLGLLLYPREQALKLAPELLRESMFNRSVAISSLLPFPPLVSVYCYEEIRAADPDLTPEEILAAVEKHLSQSNETLVKHYEPIFKEIQGKRIQSTEPLFHLAKFLKTRDAENFIIRDAWHRLSIDEIESVCDDKSWGERRNWFISQARQIDPVNASLLYDRVESDGRQKDNWATLVTLGDSFELAKLEVSNAHLVAAELADLKKVNDLRNLRRAGVRSLDLGRPGDAARFFQAGLIGDLVFGTQPGTPFNELIPARQSYLEAKALTAPTPEVMKLWLDRRKRWALPED